MNGRVLAAPITSVSEAEVPPRKRGPLPSFGNNRKLVYQRRAIGISTRAACPAKMANEDAMATKSYDQVNVTAHR